MTSIHTRKKGFTIIEVLAVFAVILILVSGIAWVASRNGKK